MRVLCFRSSTMSGFPLRYDAHFGAQEEVAGAGGDEGSDHASVVNLSGPSPVKSVIVLSSTEASVVGSSTPSVYSDGQRFQHGERKGFTITGGLLSLERGTGLCCLSSKSRSGAFWREGVEVLWSLS